MSRRLAAAAPAPQPSLRAVLDAGRARATAGQGPSLPPELLKIIHNAAITPAHCDVRITLESSGRTPFRLEINVQALSAPGAAPDPRDAEFAARFADTIAPPTQYHTAYRSDRNLEGLEKMHDRVMHDVIAGVSTDGSHWTRYWGGSYFGIRVEVEPDSDDTAVARMRASFWHDVPGADADIEEGVHQYVHRLAEVMRDAVKESRPGRVLRIKFDQVDFRSWSDAIPRHFWATARMHFTETAVTPLVVASTVSAKQREVPAP